MARTPIPALPWEFSRARSGKARAVGLEEAPPPHAHWLTLALRQRRRSWILGMWW